MDPDRVARRLPPAQRAALVAHLDALGGGFSVKPRRAPGCGNMRKPHVYASVMALEAIGLLKIVDGRSALTKDGRAVLAALLALLAVTAANREHAVRFSGQERDFRSAP